MRETGTHARHGSERSQFRLLPHPRLSYSAACVPSQNGALCECLQPHQATVRALVISTSFGASPVPLCEPSQNGCPFDRPHAHHQYVPGSTSWMIGPFWKIIGSLIDISDCSRFIITDRTRTGKSAAGPLEP
jgi:hypothetical protein